MSIEDEDSSRRAAKAPYQIERLSNNHDRSEFSCGNDSLDRFCREQVQTWQKRDLATTYVLVSKLEPTKVLGYYSISMKSLAAGDLPLELSKSFPVQPRSVLFSLENWQLIGAFKD
jgi:hypothetical protein